VDIAQLIQTIAIYALPVLFSITVHEAAHGYAARHFGDNTAYMLGASRSTRSSTSTPSAPS
jgi:Zn-dependent protease